MSQRSITPYESILPGEPLPPTEPAVDEQASTIDTAWLLGAARRRWKLILLVWIALAAVCVTLVQKRFGPTYTATTLLEVTPVVHSILNGEDQVMPEYGLYLHTQAEVIGSRPILEQALRDPGIQDLQILQAHDPVGLLRKAMSVTIPPSTQLLQIEILQQDADSAIRLSKAVLNAYMTRAGGLEAEAQHQRRLLLEGSRKELLHTLESQEQEIQKLAGEYGTSNETTFADLRKTTEDLSLKTREDLEQARRDIIDIQLKIKMLDKTTLPEELRVARDQQIENDAGVRWVRREIAQDQERLTRMLATLPESSKPVQDARQELAKRQAQLDIERKRAAADADHDIQQRYQERIQDLRLQLQDSLASAEDRRDRFQKRADEQKAEGQAIGRTEAEIKAISERRDRTKQEYNDVVKAINSLNMERLQPARINVASSPEIRPDGIKDKRKKLSVAAVAGTLLLAMAVGLGRDRIDPRLRNIKEVQTGTGLRILGAVPSVTELHTGRVTKEHFLESYRVIRETLASMAPDGEAPKSILITSAQAGEGKTSLAVSLAISLAELGSRVLLIDGDVQAPQIGRLLHLNPPSSLRTVLAEQKSLPDATTPSTITNLDVLITRGNGETARHLLNARSARRLLRDAAGTYDHIVIDSPPALGAADALVWAHAADGVIVSSLVGMSDRNAVRLACQRLQSVGANLLGSVIANVSINETYYSYSTTSCNPDSGPTMLAQRGKRRCPPLVHLPEDAPVAPDDVRRPQDVNGMR